MNYSDKLKRPEWQKKRLKIFERDNWTCCYCGSTEFTLNVHHEKYAGANPWDTPDEFLKTACEDCHQLIEAGKKIEAQYGQSLVSIGLFYVAQDKSVWVRKCKFSDGSAMILTYGKVDANQRIFSFSPEQYKKYIDFISQ